MNQRKAPEESGSDWDSLSDVNAGTTAPSTVAAAAPSAASSLRSGGATPPTFRGPIPPFDFRSEAPAAPQPPGDVDRPGRSSKGRVYDPAPARDGAASASSSHRSLSADQPVYATVAPRTLWGTGPQPAPRRSDASVRDGEAATEGGGMFFSGGAPSCGAPSAGTPSGGSHDNQAFQGDGAQLSLPPVPTPRNVRPGPSTNYPNVEHLVLNIGGDIPNDISDPMVFATNEAMRRCCDIIGVPLRLMMLLLHHTIRLVLLRIVRPLVVDSVALIIEYFLRPLVLAAIAPAFVSITAGAVMLNSLVLECLQPLYLLIASFRLVEVNIGARNAAPPSDVELTGSKRPALRHV